MRVKHRSRALLLRLLLPAAIVAAAVLIVLCILPGEDKPAQDSQPPVVSTDPAPVGSAPAVTGPTTWDDSPTYLSSWEGDALPKGALEALTAFLDDFYRYQTWFPAVTDPDEALALVPDMTGHFAVGAEGMAAVWQSAFSYLVAARTIHPNEMRLTDCSYSLELNRATVTSTTCEVAFYENCVVNFAYLPGITSEVIDLDCSATLVYEQGQWKLTSYYREEDFFLAIHRQYTEGDSPAAIRGYCENAMAGYLANLSRMESDLAAFNAGQVTFDAVWDRDYDREAAAAYARAWVAERNWDQWNAYDNWGGNCQNFASQVLFAGGIPMDTTGYYIWKYYSSTPDSTNAKTGRSPSWTAAYQFREYALANRNAFGLVSTVDANLYSAQAGDIFQVGTEEGVVGHSNVVVGTYALDGDAFVHC